MMAVHHVPSLTREKYEQVLARLTNGKTRIESVDDLPFEGLVVHMSGVGIDDPSTFFPAHTFVSR